MDEVARLLNAMVEARVIAGYAVFGAVAQMRYTEAVVTLDADILVEVAEPTVLDLLGPIYRFCEERGYQPEGEAIRVGDWPVQLIPAFSALTHEAMENAEVAEIDGVPIRVVGPDYLAVIALSVGRSKDLARILALREAGAVSDTEIATLARKHGLFTQWQKFLDRFDET